MSLAVFGIRHHGPGSARSVVRALAEFAPETVLIEGPPEADALIPFARDAAMRPPVAILAYVDGDPKRAAFYPFAEFSPEWQAMHYALERELPVRFIDLPLVNAMAVEKPEGDDTDRIDPLDEIAQAAGFGDGERWWDRYIERSGNDSGIFGVVEELMGIARGGREDRPGNEAREAAMRQAIRVARKTYGRVAVVCGAYHAPAMREGITAAADARTLQGLPKVKVATTWVPWTNGRLGFASGYGAGVESPGWYEHLWGASPETFVASWMAKAARALRAGGLDVASAHAIEATRLADSLAAVRGSAAPGLDDCTDAIRAVYCFGAAAPLGLLREKVIVGERLGTIPENAGRIPLLADLEREQKRLRLPAEASARDLDLDLRKPNDLDRSRLLHRLNILGVPWGRAATARSGTGTFKEQWQLRWYPEFVVALVESSPYGNTIGAAATAKVRERASNAETLAELTGLLAATLKGDLAAAVDDVLVAVRDRAAETNDVPHLLDAIPALAQILRYGDVRQTDLASVGAVLSELLVRACIGLPASVLALDDDAAEATYARISDVDGAVRTLDRNDETLGWNGALARVAADERVHGLVAGRATRTLFDARVLDDAAFNEKLGLALGRANDPAAAAAWIDGAFRKSGTVLVHDAALLDALDRWLAGLDAATFVEMLPLVRRTFATFTSPERASIGTRVARGRTTDGVPAPTAGGEIDWNRARLLAPVFAEIFGLDSAS